MARIIKNHTKPLRKPSFTVTTVVLSEVLPLVRLCNYFYLIQIPSFPGLSQDRSIDFSKHVLRWGRSFVSSFDIQYPIVSLRSSSSSLLLFLVSPHSNPSIFPSIPCFRRESQPRMWQIRLSVLLFTVCRMFLSYLALCNTSFFARSIQIFSILPDCFVYRESIPQFSLFL